MDAGRRKETRSRAVSDGRRVLVLHYPTGSNTFLKLIYAPQYVCATFRATTYIQRIRWIGRLEKCMVSKGQTLLWLVCLVELVFRARQCSTSVLDQRGPFVDHLTNCQPSDKQQQRLLSGSSHIFNTAHDGNYLVIPLANALRSDRLRIDSGKAVKSIA